MVWAIDNDDFKPDCSDVRYPLLKAINAEFKRATDSGGVPAIVTPDFPPIPDKSLAPSVGSESHHLILCALTSVILFKFLF